jgi:integrase
VLATGTGRDSNRGGGGEVIELECGVTVYPARSEAGRWRAVWYEAGARQQCEAATEAKLTPKLEKIVERLQADAPNMRRPGADLIAHYLDPDRLPVHDRWSRKHADTQRRLCERFAAPVIATVTCQDIKTEHTQKIVNAAPTAGEGDRVHRMLSALVSAGIDAGYLTSPRLARVHWQAGDRPLPAPAVSVAGESSLWIDPAEIPSEDNLARLGQALRDGALGERDELMANVAAYSGLRWGELAALTIAQVGQAARVITVDRKVVEVGGRLYVEAPKNRKFRRTIYPRRTPGGYPLAEQLTARVEEARAEQEAGSNALGLIFPSRRGGYWRSSNYTTAGSFSPPTCRPGGATQTGTVRGPGTACGTCSVPPRCSRGSSTRRTCRGWLGTRTTGSRSTCTSAPPPASWTAHEPPPNNHPLATSAASSHVHQSGGGASELRP